jgi:hypothetical protein
VLLPTGAGQPNVLPRGAISEYHGAWWLPGGTSLLIMAHEAGRPARLYVQALPDGEPRPVGRAATWVSPGSKPVSPDGRFLDLCPPSSGTADQPAERVCLFPVDAADAPGTPVPGLLPTDRPLAWSVDARYLYARALNEPRLAHVVRIELATGRRTTSKELRPADPAGAASISHVLLSRDAQSYVYQYYRTAEILYVVDGLP